MSVNWYVKKNKLVFISVRPKFGELTSTDVLMKEISHTDANDVIIYDEERLQSDTKREVKLFTVGTVHEILATGKSRNEVEANLEYCVRNLDDDHATAVIVKAMDSGQIINNHNNGTSYTYIPLMKATKNSSDSFGERLFNIVEVS